MVIGASTMTNSDFLAETLSDLQDDEFGWVTTFRANPGDASPEVWSGRLYRGTPNQAATIDRAGDDNTYFCTAVLQPDADGEIVRRKANFKRLAALVVDDVVPDSISNYSWAIQTSPGKHQVGILLDPDDPDCADRELIDRVMSALAARGRSNDASGNACVRYVRLPHGSNTKPRASGVWRVQMESWNPRVRWTLEDACAAVDIDLDRMRAAAAVQRATPSSSSTGSHAGEIMASLAAPLDQRSYHDNITRLAASLIAGGMFPGAAVEHLYSLMDAIKPTGPEEEVRRWQERRAEIPRAVKSAEKFAPEERKPPAITVNLNLATQAPAQAPGDVQPMDWGQLQDTEPEPTQWRLNGWLPERTVTLLSANGGVGKSNISLQLGIALTSGQEFMGIATKPSRVLIISGEDEARTVHFRVANICAQSATPLSTLRDTLTVYDLTQHDCVLWRDGQPTQRMQWLADAVVRHRADVVVIDNASDVFADNENDRAAVRGFMRCLNMICSATGAAVLLLAHVDKASVRAGAGTDTNSTFSGSTAWNNSARSRWAMTRDNDRCVVLRHEKCNLGPLQDELRLEFDTGSKVFVRFGHVPGAADARALVRNTHRAAILRLLSDAEKAGQRVSMNAAANNNAFRVLRSAPDFPRVERGDFFSLLFSLQRDGLVEEEEYKHDRKTFKRLVLTEAGRMRVATGSGAPALFKGSVHAD